MAAPSTLAALLPAVVLLLIVALGLLVGRELRARRRRERSLRDHVAMTEGALASMTDAVAVAMITPGPVVITVGFIGYLVAGPLGATFAAIGVFLPCWLFVVIPATYFRRSIGSPRVKAFVYGVTAAASGAIAGAAFVLGRRAIFDVPTVLIALGTLWVVVRTKKIHEPLVIVAAGVLGWIVWTVLR